MANSVNESAIRKLKLLFTVVDRNKAEFYLDVLSQFEVNLQMVESGMGTAKTGLHDMLGLNEGFKPKFLRQFAQLGEGVKGAVKEYIAAVKDESFPNAGESY